MQHFAFYYLVYITFEGKVNVKVTQFCPTSLGPHELSCPWNSPGQNTGVGSLSILQGIFLTQGWNPGLPSRRQILYCLSHQGSSMLLLLLPSHFSRVRLCDAMDCSLPGSSVHGSFQARVLECGATAFSTSVLRKM